MIVRHSFVGRPDHLGYTAASRNRGRVVRHQWIDHFDRKPRCTTGRRLGASPLLCTAYASAIWQYTPIARLFLS